MLETTCSLDQARGYAKCKRLNAKFVFSSNGHQFVEFNSFTGLTSDSKPMVEFPIPAALRARYEQNMGFTLESQEARPLLQQYPGGEGARRYYQDAAPATIRAISGQFKLGGTDGLENPKIFRTPDVMITGGLAALQQAGIPRDLLAETKTRMFVA